MSIDTVNGQECITPYYANVHSDLVPVCPHKPDGRVSLAPGSGSTLFATHPAILHTFLGSKMDLKRSIRKRVRR